MSTSRIKSATERDIAQCTLVFAALLGIALPLADGLLHVLKNAVPARIDPRYASIRAAVPDETTLGYVTDFGDQGPTGEYFWKAQYGLAPHLLVEGESHRLILANLQHPGKLGSLCQRMGLTPVKVDRAGVALLRPEGEP